MANALRLEQLFSRCDTSGSGLIDSDDFQDLCAGFGIEEVSVHGISVTSGKFDHDRKSPSLVFREIVTLYLRTWTMMETENWTLKNSRTL